MQQVLVQLARILKGEKIVHNKCLRNYIANIGELTLCLASLIDN